MMRRNQHKKYRTVAREIWRNVGIGWCPGSQERKGFQEGRNDPSGEMLLVKHGSEGWDFSTEATSSLKTSKCWTAPGLSSWSASHQVISPTLMTRKGSIHWWLPNFYLQLRPFPWIPNSYTQLPTQHLPNRSLKLNKFKSKFLTPYLPTSSSESSPLQ